MDHSDMKHRSEESGGGGLPLSCPHCGSVDIKYFEAKGYWRCQACDESFLGEPEEKAVHPQKIFISYPHQPPEHAELIREIRRRLQDRGHLPWFDESKIGTGMEWREQITRGILESDWFIACLSAHSVRDPGVCLNELGIALNQKAGDESLRTVLLESEKTARPPMSLTHIQWLDLQAFDSHRPRDPEDAEQQRQWEAWLDAEIGKLIASIESRRCITGDITYLTQRLKPAGFIGEIAAKATGFTGRQWLFERIEEWRQHRREERVLWLKGAAGFGKSAIAAQLAHRERSSVLGIHFCKWNDASTHDAANLVRTMAFQIASRHPDYRKLLIDTIVKKFEGDRLHTTGAQELYRELIANLLAQGMAIDAGRDRHLIIIDGLDEARGDQILDLVAGEFQRLPEWLGIIVTSRPEQEIIARMSNPYELDAQSEDNLKDVQDYLRGGLKASFGQGEGEARALDEAVAIGSRRAEGLMLYAGELLKAVERGYIDPRQPTDFPHGLAGIYHNNLRRACPDIAAYRQTTGPLLELIAGCPVHLPEKIGKAILGLGQAAFNAAVKPVSSLLIRHGSHDEASLELFHKSFGEWLIHPESPHDFQLEGDGRVRIGEFLWQAYMIISHCDPLDLQRPSENLAYVDAILPLCLDATLYWANIDELERLSSWFRERNRYLPAIVPARQAFSLRERIIGHQPLELAEAKKALVERLLEVGEYFEAIGHLHSVAAIYDKCGTEIQRADCYLLLCDAEMRSGNLDLAERNASKSRFILDECKKQKSLEYGKVLLSLGTVAFQQNRYEEALEYFEEALEILKETEGKWGALQSRAIFGSFQAVLANINLGASDGIADPHSDDGSLLDDLRYWSGYLRAMYEARAIASVLPIPGKPPFPLWIEAANDHDMGMVDVALAEVTHDLGEREASSKRAMEALNNANQRWLRCKERDDLRVRTQWLRAFYFGRLGNKVKEDLEKACQLLLEIRGEEHPEVVLVKRLIKLFGSPDEEKNIPSDIIREVLTLGWINAEVDLA